MGFAEVLLVGFVIVSAIGLAHHEPWRDEWQIWMLVRDSTSLGDLFQKLRYETGHPFLWYLCLYFPSRLTRSVVALQGVHLAIAAATVYLVARWAPFTRWQKVLFTFGYFSLYEYCLISRNYGLGMLLLFAVCALFRQRRTTYIPIACLLFLAANTNFYAMLCGAAIGLALIVEGWSDRLQRQRVLQRKWDAAISLGIWLSGMGLCYLQLIPPADGGISTSALPSGFKLSHLASSLALIWKSYAPLPLVSLHFWNQNFVSEGDAALLAIALVLGAIALFFRKPVILVLYCSGTLAIVLIAYFKHGGGMRHWGYAFVLLLVCLWLEADMPDDARMTRPGWLERIYRWASQRHCLLLTVVLTMQLVGGLFAYGMDLIHPFSQATATTAWIQAHNLADHRLVGDRDWAALSVSGALDKPMYYPASDRVGTFIIWNNRRGDISSRDLSDRINQQIAASQQNLLLVLNYPLEPNIAQALTKAPVKLAQFLGAIVEDENYYLYEIQPVPPYGRSFSILWRSTSVHQGIKLCELLHLGRNY